MAHITCLVCLVSTVSGHSKNPLEEAVLVVGSKQNLSNLLFLDIYDLRLFHRHEINSLIILGALQRVLGPLFWQMGGLIFALV
jgi:hypothetical protein